MPSISIDKKKASLKGFNQRLECDLGSGKLSVYLQGHGKPALFDASFGLLSRDRYFDAGAYLLRTAKKIAAPDWLGRGSGLELICAGSPGMPQLSLQVFSSPKQPQLFLKLTVKNTTSARLELQEMDLLKISAPAGPNLNFGTALEDLSIFRHGWDSWDVSQSLRIRELSGLLEATIDSFLFSQIFSLKQPLSLLLGFLGSQNQAGHVKYVWSGDGRQLKEFRVMAEAKPWILEAGESAESELLLMEGGTRGLQAQEDYLSLLGERMRARVPGRVPSGWCSWYYYWGDVSEAQMLKNVSALKQRGVGVDLVQLDDGWQKEVGDWLEVNSKFPHGLAYLSKCIHKAGFKAGIWLAPFLVSTRSRTFKKHPDWCVRGKDGAPLPYAYNWRADNYCLDPSHPEVKRYLMEVFRTLVHDWHFDYFKIDFLHAGSMEGNYHQAGLTRVQAFREGLGLIRHIVGERFLLACGAPIGPCIGLVDAMRIGRDTGPKWDSGYDELFANLKSKHPKAELYLRKFSEFVDIPLKGSMAFLRELMVSERFLMKWNSYGSAIGAIQDTLCRSSLHGRLWANDPDCLLMREKDTLLNAEERQSLATVVSLSGGMAFFSDDVSSLSDENVEAFSRLLPVEGKAATAPDLPLNRIPEIYAKEIERPWGRWHLVQLFNSKEHAKNLNFSLRGLGPLFSKFHVWDVWQEKYLGSQRGPLEFAAVPAHHSRFLALRLDQNKVQMLGSSFHLSQGAQEFSSFEQGKNSVRFTFNELGGKPRLGRLYFYFPDKIHLLNARSSLGQTKVSFPQEKVVCLELWSFPGNEIQLNLGMGYSKP